MLKKLSQSNKFKKEIRQLEREINSIQNNKAQLRGLDLMKKLRTQVGMIDHIHDVSLDRKVDAETIREYIDLVTNIRLELHKLIKDSKS